MAPLATPTGSGWSDQWYPTTMANLRAIAGEGHQSSDGSTMPALSAIDTVAVLGIVTPAVVSAMNAYARNYNGWSGGRVACRADIVDQSDGTITSGFDESTGTNSDGVLVAVDAKTYFSFSAYPLVTSTDVSSEPWKRYPPPVVNAPVGDTGTGSDPGTDLQTALMWFEPAFSGAAVMQPNASATGTAVLGFLRQMLADYQRMVSASAAALVANAANTTVVCPDDSLEEFVSALGALCGDLDVLSENPPPATDWSGAFHAALSATVQFVGKTVAEAANEVGKVVGNATAGLTGGFLENASVLSIVVIAIVFHLFVR